MKHTLTSLLLCLAGLILFSHYSPAQRNYTGNFNNANELMTDVSGKPIYLKVEYNIEGSPFFPAEYARASIITSTGKAYPGINVRFNMKDNLLLMMMDDGKELVAITPVFRVIYESKLLPDVGEDNIFERGFPPINKQTEASWYQALDTGKVELLKHRSASYSDRQGYGSASITRVFEQVESYYLFFSEENRIVRLEKGKEELLSAFNDKKTELHQFIESNNLKCKKESDWKAIVAYYNSL